MSLTNNTRGVSILLYTAVLVLIYWFKPLFLVEPESLGIIKGVAEPILYWLFPSVKARIITSAIVVFAFSLLMYLLNKKHKFIKAKPFIFPLVLIILLGSFHQAFILTGAHIALILIALSLEKVLSLFREEDHFADVFFVSFYMSIATLFYAKSLIFMIPISVSLIFMKTITWRDVVVYITGFALPYLVALVYFWYTNNTASYPFDFMVEALRPKLNLVFNFNTWDYICIGYVLLLALMEGYMVITRRHEGIHLKASTSTNMFLWFLILILLIYVLVPNTNPMFLSLPMGVLISNLLSRFKRPWITVTLFCLLMLLTLLRDMLSYNIHIV